MSEHYYFEPAVIHSGIITGITAGVTIIVLDKMTSVFHEKRRRKNQIKNLETNIESEIKKIQEKPNPEKFTQYRIYLLRLHNLVKFGCKDLSAEETMMILNHIDEELLLTDDMKISENRIEITNELYHWFLKALYELKWLNIPIDLIEKFNTPRSKN